MCEMTKPEEGIKYTTRFLRPYLDIVGAWPNSSSCLSSRTLQRVKHVVTYFLFFIMIIPSLLYVFLKEKNVKVKLKLIGPIINCAMQFLKYTIILWRMKEIKNGLETIRQDWTDATPTNQMIFRSKAKIGRKMVLIAAFTMYGGGMCYRIILPLLRGKVVTMENVTVRPIPCPSYFVILDEQVTPIYEIIFTLQVLSGFVTYAVICGSCGICALLVLHACSMLNILVRKMRELVDKADTNEAEVQRRIMHIVDYHVRIKKFLKNSQRITEYICLTEMLGSTCLICLVGYYVIMEWENSNGAAIMIYLTLLISFLFCLFILCYIGQLLVDENELVGQASCTVNWYRLPDKYARCLILIIAISNNPMKLRAGKMVDMSLATFTDIMKASGGYLNILRKVV